MLDQRLVRENPNLIARELGRRGLKVDIIPLQQIAQKQRDLEKERSNLQAEGNLIGKEVGNRIQRGIEPNSIEIKELRSKGNKIKQAVALLEEEEKIIAEDLKVKLLKFPNLPSPDCPDGNRRWGRPFVLHQFCL